MTGLPAVYDEGAGWTGEGESMPAPAMSADDIAKLLHAEFPQAFYPGCGHTIERVEHGDVRVRWAFDEASLRPGGTVSGPTMMELADFAMYVAVFSAIGPQPLAVTTNLNINFLRKPTRADLHRRRPFDEGRQAAGGGRGHHLFGGHGRAGGPCHRHLFDPAGPMISQWCQNTILITN